MHFFIYISPALSSLLLPLSLYPFIFWLTFICRHLFFQIRSVSSCWKVSCFFVAYWHVVAAVCLLFISPRLLIPLTCSPSSLVTHCSSPSSNVFNYRSFTKECLCWMHFLSPRTTSPPKYPIHLFQFLSPQKFLTYEHCQRSLCSAFDFNHFSDYTSISQSSVQHHLCCVLPPYP